MIIRNGFRSILTISMVVMLIACGGAEERKAKYLERGKSYFSEKNYDKAGIEFKNVVQIDPKSGDGYYWLGRVEEERQNWAKSFGMYKKAIELDPKLISAKSHLGKFLVASDKLDEAQQQLDDIYALSPGDKEGKVLESLILAKQGKLNEAIDVLTKLVSQYVDDEKIITLLSSFYKKQEKYDLAISVLNDGLENIPNSVNIRKELVKNYTRKGDDKNIEKYLKELISIDPDEISNYVVIASFYAKKDNVDQAEKILRDFIAKDDNDAERYILLSKLLAARKSVETAENELKKNIESKPDLAELSYALGKLYEQSNQAEKAKEVYSGLIEKYGLQKEGLIARNYLANIYLGKNEIVEAEKLVDEVLAESPRDTNGLFFKSKISLSRGNPTDAINSLRVILKEQPQSIETSELLAEAYLMTKQNALAEEVLQNAVSGNNTSTRPYINYSKFLVVDGRLEEALENVDIALELDPGSVAGLKQKAGILLKQKKYDDAIQIIDELKKDKRAGPMGSQFMVKAYLAKGDIQSAITELRGLLADQPGDPAMLGALINILASNGEYEEAEKEIMSQKGAIESHIIYDMLANLELSQKKFSNAEVNFKKAIDAKTDWDKPYIGLANVYLLQGSVDKAINIYQQAINNVKEPEKVLTLLAGLYEKKGEYAKAIENYEAIIKINPENRVARNNFASLVADHMSDDKEMTAKAMAYVKDYDKASHPALRDTYGWLLYRSGDSQNSLKILESVVNESPDVAVFNYHLAMAYMAVGDKLNAKTYLEKSVASDQGFYGKDDARNLLQTL